VLQAAIVLSVPPSYRRYAPVASSVTRTFAGGAAWAAVGAINADAASRAPATDARTVFTVLTPDQP
jgi:hypothetical protein